ncbi:hypothetical protein [Xanthomonas hortorum]|nr:hypothetical protein [Xanthomonas hortorum]MDT7824245.1 hypothetical protein [Xanthomonas hortorum pv. vitians]
MTLQEQRHAADFDIGKPFLKSCVLSHVKDIEDAFQEWTTVMFN